MVLVDFDLPCVPLAQPFEQIFDLLLDKRLADVGVHPSSGLFEAQLAGRYGIDHLEDRIPLRGLHRADDLSSTGVLSLPAHVAVFVGSQQLYPAPGAADSGTALGVAPGQFVHVLALLDLGEQFFGQIAGIDQNLLDADELVGHVLIPMLLVVGSKVVLRGIYALVYLDLAKAFHERLAPGLLHPFANPFRLVETEFGRPPGE